MQSRTSGQNTNALHELGYKIFLDRYAQKDMTRQTLAVGDTVIVVVDSKTGQREIGKITAMALPQVTIELLDATTVTRDLEHVDKPLETDPGQMMDRVAAGIAKIETDPERQKEWTENFRWLLEGWKFVPGGRILTGAGTDQQLTYYNCYVISMESDSRGGIMKTLSNMTEIMSRGGGVGINLSTLRPRHAYVKGVNGRSSGSVSWGALYSFVTGLIEQGGSRRGALMLILNDWHPDIFDFINSKRQAGNITNANISVGISDKFMDCVKNDSDWDLMFPDTSDPEYDQLWDGDLETWMAMGRKVQRYKTVKARDVWNAIVESAWASAEPGMWFRERSNKMSNSWYFNPLIATNPCTTGDTLVATEFGYTKARDLQVGMQIRTPAGLKPIEKVYNNGVQKIFRIEFSDGGYLECTADHKLKVVREKRFLWIPVSELELGDKVQVMANEAFGSRRRLPEVAIAHIQKRSLNVSDYFDRDLGLMIGTVLGDGTLHKTKSGNSHAYQCRIAFGANEPEWFDLIKTKVESMGIHTHLSTNQKSITHSDGPVALHQALSLACYKLATLMAKIRMPFDVKAPRKSIPEEYLTLDRDFLAGLLDGLFSTDGGIDTSKANPMLRFHTSSQTLAQQVRLLLLQFGIHARIYKGKRKRDLMYDGRSMYGTGLKYDVLIMNEGIPRFYSEIGLSHPAKAQKLKDIAENTYFIGGTWVADVKSIEDTGREEEVFDVYEPDTLTWITNGYVSFDCGEQSLGAFSVCNLGAINLAKFYDAEKHEVAWDDLKNTVRYSVRFLDNIIDSTPYFFEENARVQGSERRIGLGTMGIAELMVKLRIRYGGQESLDLIDKLYKFIAVESYTTSSEIAKEKGSFPAFDAEKFLESGFMQTMPEEVRQSIQQNGIRNVTLLTQAPTGSTGTMVNTSTGIEPFFSWVYYRKSRLGLHEEKMPIAQEWLEQHPDETKLPDYFVTAMELAPEEHVRVQAAFQRWIDSSISKTANIPNEWTVEQVADLYMYMYDTGCKGGTIYRDGSRDEQVLMLKGDERAESEKKQIDAAKESKPAQQVATPHRVYPRPGKLVGATVKCNTPFGTAYVTMNSDEHGYPFEVFITAPGKAGSDLQADAEGLGRMISLSLRTTDPHNRLTMLRLIIEQLRDIGGARSVGFGESRVASLPDAVARAMEETYFPKNQPQQLKLFGDNNGSASIPTAKIEVVNPVNSSPNGSALASNGALSTADVCPSCANITLIRAEGCRKCLTCGYSEC